MMAAAQRNSEFVAHFAGQCATLRKAQMMRIRGKSTAHQARMGCDQPDVVAVANPPGFRQRQYALVDGTLPERTS